MGAEEVERRLAAVPAGHVAAFSLATAKDSASADPLSLFHTAVKRRDLLLFGTSTAVFSRSVFAANQLQRVGFVAPGRQQANQNLLAAFHDGLTSLGWMGGRNIIVLDRWGEDRTERLLAIAKELVASGIDTLVTVGTEATLAAQRATSTTPIIFVGVGDPVAIGAVGSLAQPGGRTTGLSLISVQLIAMRFQLLKELLPGLRRVAVLVRNEPGLEQRLAEIRGITNWMGIKPVEFVTTTGSALKLAFRWLKSDPCDALYVASGPLGPAKRAEVIALAAEERMPAMYPFRVFALAGGLMSLAADEHDLFRRAAIFVDKILKGTYPADIPVEEPAKFELLINLKTAKALGLVVPQSLLARADAVIE